MKKDEFLKLVLILVYIYIFSKILPAKRIESRDVIELNPPKFVMASSA